jgi:hypothetical protein
LHRIPNNATSRKEAVATDNDQPNTNAAAAPPALTIAQLEELDDTFFVTLRKQADKCESFYLHLMGQLRSQQQRVFFEDYQVSIFYYN